MGVTRRIRDEAWTPDQMAEHEVIRARFAASGPGLDELVASREVNPESIATLGQKVAAAKAASLLRREREATGLSLTDVAERSGIERSALSKLETGVHSNPTVSTLARYAAALGKELHWSLVDPGATTPGS